MTKFHSDSEAIDRIGTPVIVEHLGVTRQAVFYWRRQGVPNDWRDPLARLGKRLGHEMPEMKTKRDRRRGRPPHARQSPTSPATPA
jgi:hypothetical protein